MSAEHNVIIHPWSENTTLCIMKCTCGWEAGPYPVTDTEPIINGHRLDVADEAETYEPPTNYEAQAIQCLERAQAESYYDAKDRLLAEAQVYATLHLARVLTPPIITIAEPLGRGF